MFKAFDFKGATILSKGFYEALKVHSGVHLHPEEERHFQKY